GAFVGQLTNEPIEEVNILLDGAAAEMNVNALDCAVIAGMLKPAVSEVNMVSAPVIAADRGIKTSITTQAKSGPFDAYIKLRIKTPTRERAISGTVFADGKPRFIMIKGITIDAEVGQHMLYTTNKDVPGIIGALGATMGAHGVNIANFTLGRTVSGGDAIALLYVDAPVPELVLNELRKTELFQSVVPLEFEV
ncbi:MAG: ACT domain-containing protein, partial [Maritimibacter sp.]|nr:ACT domain-containing protein [Maritimibacter sp.]